MFLVIMVGKKVNKYKSVIKQEKEIAKATIEKNWIIFWVWVPESYEHEMLVAGGSGQGQNLVFLSFQGHNVDFFDISRGSVYVLVRSLRSLSGWWCCAFI